jgi:UDP-N-acetylglucosamine--dolichyl-phosphate N-acetylglucosaminephosphotransferase
MLEGYNGLGSGLGIIVTSTLIVISLISKRTDGLYLLIPLLGVLLGFFYFNKYPSKIFPGDTLMFFQGATIGCAAIIGNFPSTNHGTVTREGKLIYKGKAYSLCQLLIKQFKLSEKKLVYVIWAVEATLCGIVLMMVYWLGPEYAW